MTNTSQKLIVLSMIVSGIVGVMSLADLALGIPFGRQIATDVMFLIGAGIVIYMGIDAYKEMQ